MFPKKTGAHTAKSDILESIEQLKWYRKYYFKLEEETKETIESLSLNYQKRKPKISAPKLIKNNYWYPLFVNRNQIITNQYNPSSTISGVTFDILNN